jgi:hypothetical protein
VSREEEEDVGMRKALLLLALGLAACDLQGLPGSGEAYWKVWAR